MINSFKLSVFCEQKTCYKLLQTEMIRRDIKYFLKTKQIGIDTDELSTNSQVNLIQVLEPVRQKKSIIKLIS